MEQLIRPAAAAKILDIDRSTLWRLQTNGEITYIRVGNQVRFRPSDLEAYIAASERGKARHQPTRRK